MATERLPATIPATSEVATDRTLGPSAVVVLTRKVLEHEVGTIGLVVHQRPAGRFRYEVMVPGHPTTFFVTQDHVHVAQGWHPSEWWRFSDVDDAAA